MLFPAGSLILSNYFSFHFNSRIFHLILYGLFLLFSSNRPQKKVINPSPSCIPNLIAIFGNGKGFSNGMSATVPRFVYLNFAVKVLAIMTKAAFFGLCCCSWCFHFSFMSTTLKLESEVSFSYVIIYSFKNKVFQSLEILHISKPLCFENPTVPFNIFSNFWISTKTT